MPSGIDKIHFNSNLYILLFDFFMKVDKNLGKNFVHVYL